MTVLLLSCPDRPGLVAATAGLIHDRGGNIVHADQTSVARPGTGILTEGKIISSGVRPRAHDAQKIPSGQ